MKHHWGLVFIFENFTHEVRTIGIKKSHGIYISVYQCWVGTRVEQSVSEHLKVQTSRA